MSELSNSRINFIRRIFNYIKTNFKYFLGFLIIIFIFFVGYQYYSFYQKKNVLQNSISYFNSKALEPNKEYYQIINELSNNNDFYSIITKLEMISYLFIEKKYDEANELYFNLLTQKNLNNIYKASIAAHAAYNNLNIMYDTSNLNMNSTINEFIDFIDDDLEGYKGIKLELKYLLAVSEQDINEISSSNDTTTNEMYELIQNSANISSTIKERVKSIHEYQKYK